MYYTKNTNQNYIILIVHQDKVRLQQCKRKYVLPLGNDSTFKAADMGNLGITKSSQLIVLSANKGERDEQTISYF